MNGRLLMHKSNFFVLEFVVLLQTILITEDQCILVQTFQTLKPCDLFLSFATRNMKCPKWVLLIFVLVSKRLLEIICSSPNMVISMCLSFTLQFQVIFWTSVIYLIRQIVFIPIIKRFQTAFVTSILLQSMSRLLLIAS